MKFAVLALACIFSSSAFACPDLKGRFECKDFNDGSVQDVTITQTAFSGGMSYQLKIVTGNETQTRNYVADGKVKTMDHPRYNNYTERTSCDGSKIKVDVNGARKDNGAALKAMVTVNLTSAGDLYDNYVGTEGASALNFEEVCKRK